MAKGLSWAAIFFAAMTVVLVLLSSRAAPSEDELVVTLSLLAGVLAPLVAVAGLLLAKRSGKRAPRLARVALAFGCGAFSWPLLLIVAFSSCPGGLC
jgi:drug/metabolite transporter (DMT)-like permease